MKLWWCLFIDVDKWLHWCEFERGLAWSVLLLTMIRIIAVVKMLWTYETQPSESTTNFDHCDDNQIARSVAIVVKICFDICCIRLMDRSFGIPLSPGQPTPPPPHLPGIWNFELSPGLRMVSYQVIKCTYPVTFAKLSNGNVDWVSLECRLSIDQVLIECRLRVSIKGIDRHSTMDVFSTHNPAYL